MNSLIGLFALHFLADFVLQSRKMGKNKSTHWGYLLGHLAIQFAVFLPFTGWKFALSNALIHGAIDKNIWNLYKGLCYLRLSRIVKNDPRTNMQAQITHFKYWEDHLFYTTIGLDQLLHGITLIYLFGKFL